MPPAGGLIIHFVFPTNFLLSGWLPLTIGLPLIVILLFSMFLAGTSLAFVKPEHVLAAPFRGVAITLTKASAGAIGLIEDVRGIAATSEPKTVSTALQSMRVE